MTLLLQSKTCTSPSSSISLSFFTIHCPQTSTHLAHCMFCQTITDFWIRSSTWLRSSIIWGWHHMISFLPCFFGACRRRVISPVPDPNSWLRVLASLALLMVSLSYRLRWHSLTWGNWGYSGGDVMSSLLHGRSQWWGTQKRCSSLIFYLPHGCSCICPSWVCSPHESTLCHWSHPLLIHPHHHLSCPTHIIQQKPHLPLVSLGLIFFFFFFLSQQLLYTALYLIHVVMDV